MSSDSNQENNKQKNATSANNTNDNSEKKDLTFKDWKKSREQQNKSKDTSQNKRKVFKFRTFNKSCNAGSDNKNNCNNNSFNSPGISNFQGASNCFAGNNNQSCFGQKNNWNVVNNYENRLSGPNSNNNLTSVNNSFHSGNCNTNFDVQNNFSSSNSGNRFNNSLGRNNYTNSSVLNSFRPVPNRLNGSNNNFPCNNLNLPESFFATDGIYRQKDLMQKPLPNYNPFRNEHKSNELLKEFDKARYTKDKKTKAKKKSADAKKTSVSTKVTQSASPEIRKLLAKPEVYVPNPKAKSGGKQYKPKPKLPEQNQEISKEEKKQQWKEYRKAMKPFKNRDFYNAKRVVQRLGKIAPSELDEKQIIRLANARTIMQAHKARLSAKYPNYIKEDETSKDLGEVYVLRKKSLNETDVPMTTAKKFDSYDNFSKSGTRNDFTSASKIGGDYKRFLSGGTLKGTMQKLVTQYSEN